MSVDRAIWARRAERAIELAVATALHGRTRWAVAVAGAAVALLPLRLPELPPATTQGVADLLGEAIGGQVDPDEYVWEGSDGAVSDLVFGRGVVFLGRASPGAPREAYRARVRVTHDGRPLAAGALVRLTDTTFGDERDLVVSGGRAAFATHFDGRFQSVAIATLDASCSVRRVALPSPAERLQFQLSANEMVLVAGDRRGASEGSVIDIVAMRATSGIDLEVTGASAVPAGPIGVRPTSALIGVPPTSSLIGVPPNGAPTPVPAGAPGTMPPEGYTPMSLGTIPPLAYQREDGSISGLYLDGRQLDFSVVVGRQSPASATGFVADGRTEGAWRSRAPVLALAIPAPHSVNLAGAFRMDAWIAPIPAGAMAVTATGEGRLHVGPWPLAPWQRASEIAGVEWAGSEGRPGHHAACVTDAGHLAMVWSDSAGENAVIGALPRVCAVSFVASGVIEMVATGDAGVLPETSERSLLLAARRDWSPGVPLPRPMQWLPATSGLPEPAFIPAIHVARTDTLGTDVTVYHIDASRFDWTIVAGERERMHRLGGEFPRRLPEAQTPRARLSLSLGVGKRKRPRGLRIGSSTGLSFFGAEATLLVSGGGVRVAEGAAAVDDQVGDGSELMFTVHSGEVGADGRRRGPLQQRADLCSLPGDQLLLAVAEFDSHEATASTLALLGCEQAVALDRGSEDPAALGFDDQARGPFRTTTLLALERPLLGRVSSLTATE